MDTKCPAKMFYLTENEIHGVKKKLPDSTHNSSPSPILIIVPTCTEELKGTHAPPVQSHPQRWARSLNDFSSPCVTDSQRVFFSFRNENYDEFALIGIMGVHYNSRL